MFSQGELDDLLRDLDYVVSCLDQRPKMVLFSRLIFKRIRFEKKGRLRYLIMNLEVSAWIKKVGKFIRWNNSKFAGEIRERGKERERERKFPHFRRWKRTKISLTFNLTIK